MTPQFAFFLLKLQQSNKIDHKCKKRGTFTTDLIPLCRILRQDQFIVKGVFLLTHHFKIRISIFCHQIYVPITKKENAARKKLPASVYYKTLGLFTRTLTKFK